MQYATAENLGSAAFAVFAGIAAFGTVSYVFGSTGVAVLLGFTAVATFDQLVDAVENLADAFPEWEFAQAAARSLRGIETLAIQAFEVVMEGAKKAFSEVLIVSDVPEIEVSSEGQHLLAVDVATLKGGGLDDTLSHMGTGKIDAGGGNDAIFAVTSQVEGSLPSLEIFGGSGDDHIYAINSIESDDPQSLKEERKELIIDAGINDDIVEVYGAAEINLGDGIDTLVAAGIGSVIELGPGGSDDIDRVRLDTARGTLIKDADGYDEIAVYGFFDVAGTYRKHRDSESKYFYGLSGALRVGINDHGELVIGDRQSTDGDETSFIYIANYNNSPDANSSELSAGIRLAETWVNTWQLLKGPGIDDQDGDLTMWELIERRVKDIDFKATAGGVDPLVLDLDGDGLELTSMVTGVSPMFDMDGDGFAEHTGWVAPDDGMLALDSNGNGVIDDIGELFGGAGQSGFSELAQHDDNSDGIIDANDAVFNDLRVWRDLDRDGETDAGELFSLADLNIQSISLQATEDGSTNALNTVERTGSFTYADGTTGEVGDVTFRINNYNTVYTGDTTIAPEVLATMPKLKGHGTLADLQVSVTLDGINGALAQTINTVLPTLNVVDLDVLYERATTILNAWTNAAPVLPNTGNYSDVPAFISRTDGQIDVRDFAYQTSETITLADDSTVNVTFWRTAGGTPVKDDQGQTIDYPTLEELLAHQSGVADLSWEMVSAEKFAFMERYFGEEIPINDPTGFSSTSVSGFAGMLETTERVSEQLTLRLAMQGGLKDYFDGVEYSVEDDRFRPTTDFELIPFFKKVFETAPADAAGAESWLTSWKPLIDALLSDFERPGGNNINAPFIFTNVVAAYETIGLPVSLAVAAESLGISPDIVDYGSGTRTGTNDQEIFYMSTGDDVVESKAGSDVFVFGENFGHDVINDYESSADSFDTIRFAHLTPEDIVAIRDGKDLVLTVTATGDSVRVTGQFHDINYTLFGSQVGPFQGIEEIVFANGDVWGAGEIAEAVSHPLDTDETLIGTDHFDVLDGGLGDDFLQGGNNFDIYRFDAGYGHDTILDRQMNVGSEGMDVVMFGEGLTRDEISFFRDGNSNTLIINTTGGDSLTIQGQFFGSTALGQEYWIDRIESFQFEKVGIGSLGFSHEDIMRELVAKAKTDGDDVIYGFTFDDVLDGGAGNDTLIGGNKNDTYKFGFGYGSDIFDEGGANVNVGFENTDRVLFGAGVTEADVTLERDGNSADLTVRLSDGSEFKILRQFLGLNIDGSHIFAIETFEFEDGTIWNQEDIYDRMLQGTTGDDSLYGFWRDDVLDGGAGNDYLNGGDGNDTYVFGFGYGEDVVYDQLVSIFTNDSDKLLFGPGVTQADVTWSRDGGANDLIATLSDGSQLTINSQFTYDNFGNKHYAIEQFEFEDGSTVSLQEIKDQLIQPTAGDDVLYGFASEDVFDGGAGNDVYHGGEYADTYHFGYGYGHDLINDFAASAFIGGDDRIVFGAGIETSEVSVTWTGENGLDLTLTVETGETITISNYRSKIFGFSFNTVEEVLFEDGTLWRTSELMARYVEGAISNGDDSIEGFGDLGGEIRALAGNDTIFGFHGNNTYVGGAGDDHITGGEGDDTYIYETGDGNDTLVERSADGNDTLVFGAAIESADIEILRDLSDIEDVRLKLGDGSEILLDNQIQTDATAGIENFVFSDGTSWTAADLRQKYEDKNLTDSNDFFVGYATSDTINGGLGDDELHAGLGNDTVIGSLGNDYLIGGRGDDTYVFTRGDGVDLIEDGGFGSEADKILLHGYAPEEVIVSQIAGTNDILLSFIGTSDAITLKNNAVDGSVDEIAQIVFDNGLIWESAHVRDLIDGEVNTDGDDVFWGTNNADTLVGGLGDDHLRAGAGPDTYVYTRGDGHDRITELQSDLAELDQLSLIGIASDEVTVSRSGETVVLTIAPSTTSGSDGGSISLEFNLQGAGGAGVERILFEDGTTWTGMDLRARLVDHSGTDNNDTIDGTSGENILAGGLGDDVIDGGNSGDTYLYARGDGDDEIIDGRTNHGEDIVRLEGILPDEILLERIANDLRIVIAETSAGAGDGGSILLRETLDADFNRGIEKVIFDNGIVWTRGDLRAKLLEAAASDGNDTIVGFNASDTIRGGLGDDILTGGNGGDTYIYLRGDGDDSISDMRTGFGTDTVRLEDIIPEEINLERDGNNVRIVIAESVQGAADGGSITLVESLDADFNEGIEQVIFADGTVWSRGDIRAKLIEASQTDGDDTVIGFNVADTIEGGLGNDTLQGGSGGDTYVYSRGDGNDTVIDGRLGAGEDRVQLVGINPDEVSIERDGNDIRLVILESVPGAGDEGTITLAESLDADFDEGVEKVVFEDGTIWSRGDIRVMLIEASQTDSHDTVTGYNTGDVLQGGLGDDLLQGGEGDDTYIYTRGDGHDTIDENSFSGYNDTLSFTDINPAQVSVYRDGDHILLVIAESTPGAGDGGSIVFDETARNWFGSGVDKVVFADGSEWSRSDMLAMAVDNSAPIASSDIFTSLIPGDPIEITYAELLSNDSDPDNDTLSITGFQNIVGGQLTIGANESISIVLDDPDVPVTFDYLVTDGVYTRTASVTAGYVQPDVIDELDPATINGTSGDDLYRLAGGTHTINLGTGADTLIVSADTGDYTLYDTGSGAADENDRIIFAEGIALSDVRALRNGDHVVLSFEGLSGSITIKDFSKDSSSWHQRQIDWFEFSDGTVLSHEDFFAETYFKGTVGNDVITGTYGVDTFTLGLGSDTLYLNRGSDRIVMSDAISDIRLHDWGRSSSDVDDTLVFADGITIDEIIGTRDGDHIRLSFTDRAGSITIEQASRDVSWYLERQIDWFEFSDGTRLSYQDFYAQTYFMGTDGNDVIRGTYGADTFTLGLGSDTIYLHRGSDRIVMSDAIGDIRLHDWGRSSSDVNDTLVFADGVTIDEIIGTRDGDHIRLSFTDRAGSITIEQASRDVSWYLERQIDWFEFSDGTRLNYQDFYAQTYFKGTDGDDVVRGTYGADTFTLGLGSDTIYTHRGSDRIIMSDAIGDIRIQEWGRSSSDLNDTLVFASGITIDQINVTYSEDDLVLTFDGRSGSIAILEALREVSWYQEYQIEWFEFSDGTRLSHTDFLNQTYFSGTDQSDDIFGTYGNDVLNGGDGDDILNGGRGDDDHYGGAGNDLIIANQGADTFDGGADVDTLDFTFAAGDEVFDLTAGTVAFESGGSETILNFENLIAGSGDNRIIGSSVDNQFTGGGGSDTFVFSVNAGGHDTITDFSAGAGSADLLEFTTGQFADFAAVIAAATDDGADTTIAIDAATSIVLKSVLVADLHQDDFQFV
ncbi:calcium-binding protein [Roseibium sp. HPY-6]|uniref:calcium-binding protein n=1 Tax=Roseibium sp. HPY-6 TaxID=3229852 RepID=UPI00338EE0AB